MAKPKFNKKRIEKLIHKIFPNSKIKNFEKFSTGLVSPTYKVELINPKRTIVVKLAKIKNERNIRKNNQILNYLNANMIPTPKVFLCESFDKKIITVMECSQGKVASGVYKNGNLVLRREILTNAGKTLRKIHGLKIPAYWVHKNHEIRSEKEWKKWTKLRINKYLEFSKNKFSLHYSFLEKELNDFFQILNKEKIDFVPLHWDYHLSNINCDKNGKITGVFDFDNSMKGHSLADLGQTAYWIRFLLKDYRNFKFFLKGYKRKFTNIELKLIRGYFLLHILAVTRSIWSKRRLKWIIDEHKKILDEFRKGKI